jgi:hypothetical protein
MKVFRLKVEVRYKINHQIVNPICKINVKYLIFKYAGYLKAS